MRSAIDPGGTEQSQPCRPRQDEKRLHIPPRRLRLFRGAKFDLQTISAKANGLPAVRIDRKSGWENPFLCESSTPAAALDMFYRWLTGRMLPGELRGCWGGGRFSNGTWLANRRQELLQTMPALRGKNLACWCRLRDPCHGDVLLEIANTPAIRAGSHCTNGK